MDRLNGLLQIYVLPAHFPWQGVDMERYELPLLANEGEVEAIVVGTVEKLLCRVLKTLEGATALC